MRISQQNRPAITLGILGLVFLAVGVSSTTAFTVLGLTLLVVALVLGVRQRGWPAR